jgi:dihydropteroate synthase
MLFRARQFEFRFPRPALVMGIVNVTPDSFSDGGKFFTPEVAVAHALELDARGADILDIGGESSRPGAEPVGEAEELRRVIPVIEKLAGQVKIPLSIDTMKPAVAHAALSAGASVVNDVGASRADDAMGRIVAEFQAGYICMHAPASGTGVSPDQLHQIVKPAKNQAGTGIVQDISDFFQERLRRLNGCGVTAEQVVFDPGIGFGKTLEQNLSLLAGLENFKKCGRPLLLGVSRKSFIGKILGPGTNERLPASLACATLALANGVQIIRTHDVAETVQALRMAEAILARRINVEQPR